MYTCIYIYIYNDRSIRRRRGCFYHYRTPEICGQAATAAAATNLKYDRNDFLLLLAYRHLRSLGAKIKKNGSNAALALRYKHIFILKK
jgi:hypothetical protein